MIKYVFLFGVVSLLAVLQSSVFSLFSVYEVVPNYLIIFVGLYLLLEKEKSSEGIFVAGVSGVWIDLLSSSYFGMYTLLFLVSAYILKLIFKKYVGFSIIS